MELVLELSEQVTVLDFGRVIATGRTRRHPIERRRAGCLPRHGRRMSTNPAPEPLLAVEDLDVRYGDARGRRSA